jgi:hypothetical protein
MNEFTQSNITSLLNHLRDVDRYSIDLETLEISEEGSASFKARKDGKKLHVEVGDLTFFIVMSSRSELLLSESYEIKNGWEPVKTAFLKLHEN